MPDAVIVCADDLKVLKQKADRLRSALGRAEPSNAFGRAWLGAAKDLIRAADIILTEHLPGDAPAKGTAP